MSVQRKAPGMTKPRSSPKRASSQTLKNKKATSTTCGCDCASNEQVLRDLRACVRLLAEPENKSDSELMANRIAATKLLENLPRVVGRLPVRAWVVTKVYANGWGPGKTIWSAHLTKESAEAHARAMTGYTDRQYKSHPWWGPEQDKFVVSLGYAPSRALDTRTPEEVLRCLGDAG